MKDHKPSKNVNNHLYNPKDEGIGSYDVHYINAYIKNRSSGNTAQFKNIKSEKEAA